MANPERGEVDFTFDDKYYTLKFSNAGRRVAETELDMELPEINRKMDAGGPGPRIISALFFGATRKFHARDFPNMLSVDNLMDDIEDAEDGTEAYQELVISVMAAYLRVAKEELKRRMEGEAPEEPSENVESPKETDTKAQPKGEITAVVEPKEKAS